jgi:hypothetical protein
MNFNQKMKIINPSAKTPNTNPPNSDSPESIYKALIIIKDPPKISTCMTAKIINFNLISLHSKINHRKILSKS